MRNFQELESLSTRLLSLMFDEFSDSEIQEVKEFIQHSEYGLALETFIDIVSEESKNISQETLDVAMKTAAEMDHDCMKVEQKMLRFVVRNGEGERNVT